MNIRYKVYYLVDGKNPMELPYKKVRANSKEKAMEIFKHKHPGLIPVCASLY